MVFDKYNVKEGVLVTQESEEEPDMPSYKDRGWILAGVLADDGQVTVCERAYDGAAFWIEEEIGVEYFIQEYTSIRTDGWWVIEGTTGTFYKGDGYVTDDEVEWNYEFIRPALKSETGSLYVKSCANVCTEVECK